MSTNKTLRRIGVCIHLRHLRITLSSVLCLLALSALQPFSPSALSSAPAQTQFNFTPPPDLRPAKKPISDKWTFTLLPVGLQKNPKIDYAIVTEMTNDGRKLPEPSIAAPVYYISHSVGQKNAGDAYGGMKDIPYEYLQERLITALASNGYRPVDPEHLDDNKIPTQVLFFAWGMHNKIEIPEYVLGLLMSGRLELVYNTPWYKENLQNKLDRAKTIGGQKFAKEYASVLAYSTGVGDIEDDSNYSDVTMRNFAERDDTTGMLVYAVSNDCYYLIVTAYDLEALAQNQKKLLWVTRISTISRGVNFKATLPIMINNASYYFGRETPPVMLLKRAYKRAEVTIGEASVVDYITGTAKPAATGTTTPASGEIPSERSEKPDNSKMPNSK